MKYVCSFLLIVMATFAFGQSLDLKSSKWYYSNQGGSDVPNSTLRIVEYSHDTTINGTLANVFTDDKILLYRNDSLFRFNDYTQEFALIFDYSASAGDTVLLESDTLLLIAGESVLAHTSVPYVIDSVVPITLQGESLLEYKARSVSGVCQFSNAAFYSEVASLGNNFQSYCFSSTGIEPYLKCFENKNISLNFSDIPCDSIVPDNETSLEDKLIKPEIKVFPNPSSAVVNIVVLEEAEGIVIYNAMGKEVWRKEGVTSPTLEVDLKKQPKGIYFVHLVQDGKLIGGEKLILH